MTASYSPKTFSSESSKWLLDLRLADSGILYFRQVLESIHNMSHLAASKKDLFLPFILA